MGRNVETIGNHARAALGLVEGLGRLLVREAINKVLVPEGLMQVDMEALNQYITETAELNPP